MRIDRLEIQNFKGFAQLALDFDPHFTLLVGDNGSGKTSVLDALAVAAAIWLVDMPIAGRNINRSEIRLESEMSGDRTQFVERRPVVIKANGEIGGHAIAWTRQIRIEGSKPSNSNAKSALEIARTMRERDEAGDHVLIPVLAYYGAGRAWLTSKEPKRRMADPAMLADRWAAFRGCFEQRKSPSELTEWFAGEAIATGTRGGTARPGFEVVQRAILRCVPGADRIWFDSDLRQIVLSINNVAQPFENLSAGQKMMLAMVADLAIKAVTQNNYLVPPDKLGPEDDPLPRILGETPGVVLIDELDVHLHPQWQRTVARDLKRTFPSIQFVCTSHSPQVIGELQPQEIRVLSPGEAAMPLRTFGIDSNRILSEVQLAPFRDPDVAAKLHVLADTIERDDFPTARALADELQQALGEDDPEVAGARTLIEFIEGGIKGE